MKRVRYSKYVPDPASEMSMEDLLGALSDYLLQSGFQDYMFYELPDGEHTMEELRRAIERALLDGDFLDEQMRERLQQMQKPGQATHRQNRHPRSGRAGERSRARAQTSLEDWRTHRQDKKRECQ